MAVKKMGLGKGLDSMIPPKSIGAKASQGSDNVNSSGERQI